MALATTTLAAAVDATQNFITVASATSVAAGRLVKVDDEIMLVHKTYVAASTTVPVLRGTHGTQAFAHPSSANAVHGDAADFDGSPAQGVAGAMSYVPRVRRISYSAAGAITLPNEGETMVAILNGTDALAMTIADPGDDIDGAMLYVLSNGTAAHTLTFASGLGGESTSYDVLTQNSNGPCAYQFVACNGYWLAFVGVAMTGTVTNITAGLA
jgi:hypothetical protein